MKCLLKIFILNISMITVTVLSESAIEEVYNSTSENAQNSKILNEDQEGNWLPVPIPISNPTVGTGLQGILLYIHPQKSTEKDNPNPTSGVALMYTDSDSKLLGIFHDICHS